MTYFDTALLALLLLTLLGLGAALWPGRRAAPRPDPRARAALRQKAETLALRGRILAITPETSLPDLTLTPLGEVWLSRPKGVSAEGALAVKAAARFPLARALTGLRQRPKGGRVEWSATACAASPRHGTEQPRTPRPQATVLVDGSNVVMWEKNSGLTDKAQLATLQSVIDLLMAEGRAVKVIFDANIAYTLFGRGMSVEELTRRIARPAADIEMTAKGQIADAWLIDSAFTTGATIVSNDLYRDHPRARFLSMRRGFSHGGVAELLPPR
ncbi:Zc3h12a-like ribonuclease protein [Gemmobacter caeni]|uniref:Zc3h12a-like ribonuclease protein n=1 Tax=Gemmobacter caeni TaxID=589035 RepID=A0A2T6BBX9_9RHOB|nr:hypothetical protein [Gemmobacter caeni]PTX53579.1 Zc3h12a-like ribonuclease protein [Gemmobacter caeni]TWJ05690.1 Zc3h12a-like ribonuclease protein [Gemmobacter caeni]